MRRDLYALALLVLSAGIVSGECPTGYQPGKVLKAFDQDVSSAARLSKPQAEGQSRQANNATTVRILIFALNDAGVSTVQSGKRYELRMRLGANDRTSMPTPGEGVCFRNDGGSIHVLTDQGKPLPGIALPIPTLPRR